MNHPERQVLPTKPSIASNSLLKGAYLKTSPVLKGIGQIMLQENALSGLFFLAGIFAGSVTMGLAAIAGAVTGTIFARLLGFNPKEIEQGLYGFSPALVGVALFVFLKPDPLTWLLLPVGSVLAAWIQHFFLRKNIPVFTLPFVLVTWGIVYGIPQLFPDLTLTPAAVNLTTGNDFTTAFRAFGQVIFQEKPVSGLLFFAGVWINQPLAALAALASACITSLMAAYFLIPSASIEEGLFGYNAVLCAIAFTGYRKSDGAWIALSVLLSGLLSIFMWEYQLIQLTFPFVIASMLVFYLRLRSKPILNSPQSE